ncbi:serine incorporator/TMS membrane protein [Pavlovales sp. CCMP2436]|nr:serine incorporator/TMS membrane protein [Pavlovales sp. CCMP2436]
MRGVLGIVGTLAGSCLGTCCAGMACSACQMVCRGSSQGARIGYLILLVLGVVMSLVLRFQLAPAMLEWHGTKLADECDSAQCAGNEAVYRVAGTMCVFFLALALLCACPGGFGAGLHRGYWAVKLFVLTSLCSATLWLPNAIFDAFASMSRVASVLFVLYQGLLLIDFAYEWNSKWVSLDEEADAFQWRAGILAVCVALYTSCFTAVGFMYALYTAPGCSFSTAIVTVTLLAILLFTLLGVSPLSPHGALLPSAIIAADCVYLCYSALASTPVAECNPFAAVNGGESHEGLHIAVGLAMAGVSIAWKANSAASSLTAEQQTSSLLPLSAPGTGEVAAAADDGDDKDEGPLEGDACFFHLMMAVSCMYFGTLLTDWGTASPEHGDISQYDVGWASAWVKVCTQWSIILMYSWTLVAPYAFPDREFV